MQNKFQIVLHAGGPKTGSSSIQRCFHPSEPLISKSLFDSLPFRLLHRPDSKLDYRPRANQAPFLDFCWQNVSSSTDIENWKKHYLCQIADISEQPFGLKFVFSAERAGAPRLNLFKAQRLALFLESIAPVSRVLYYARPFISLCLSLGLQRVKSFAIRPRGGSLFQTFKLVQSNHIVDKYDLLSACYQDSSILFRAFNRNLLAGNDVRVDFATHLNTPDEIVESLCSELSRISFANESIDLPVLILITKIYEDLSIPEKSQVPSFFNQFISVGNWSGPPCSLIDLFSPEEINYMYCKSLEEIAALKSFSLKGVNCLAHIAEAFSAQLLPKEYYLTTDHRNVDIDSYSFTMTIAQRKLVEGAIRLMEIYHCLSRNEYQVLASILDDSLDTPYLAIDTLPILFSVGKMLNAFE